MSTLSLRNVSYRPRTGSVASRNSTAFTPKLTPNKSQSNLSATPIRPPNFERQSSLPFPDDSMVLSPYHMIDGSGDLQLIRPQSIMSQTQNETLRNQSSLNKSHTKFFIQPGTRKLGAYVESKRFARRKADCSLTRILSYSKNGELDDENPTISYKQHVNLQQKKKTINKMIKTVFQKKDPIPVHPKTPTKLVQTFAHSTSAEHFSYMANNFQAGSPTNVVKLQQFLKAFKLPMTPQAQAFSHIANFSALETDSPYMGARGGNTSGREYPPQIPGFISLAESPTNKIIIRNRSGSINRTTTADMKNRQTITTRPGTTQSYMKRPGTSLKPSKTDTNLLKLNVNLNDNERTRLDNYMNMDFNDGLVYTDSVIKIDKERKNDEIKMENLTQVKQYLLEKAREGNHVTKLHQEYKSKIGEKLINSNGDKNKLLALSTSEPRDQEIPLGMPRTGNFELAHSDEYHLKSNVHKPFIGPNKNLLANPKENKGKLKKMISLHSTQFLSQFPSPASKHQRKLLKSMKTEDLWNIETKFERFRRIRKCLKEKLLLLSRMKISLEEFLVQKILPTQPYEHEYAEDFIKAAKRGDAEELEAMLKDAKQLIFQFDSSRQTALHWAAKRGHLEVIELLLRYGAEIDALDITFRTPIYYALREGSSEIVRILLLNKADPWSTRTTNYKTACSDFKCLRYLNRARKLSLILAFYDFRVRADIWSREAENMLAPVAEALRTEED